MRLSQTTAASLLISSFLCGLAIASPGDCVNKGDGNGDCRIAMDDVQDFLVCMSGPSQATPGQACACYDADVDGDVDLPDFLALQIAFTGDALLPGCDLTADDYEPGSRAIPPSITALEVTAPTAKGPIKWMSPESLARSVYLFSGEVYAEASDLQIPGRGFDFVWARKYRSRVGPDTAQGVGWDYCYNVRIEQSAGDLILHDGNTRADRYGAVQGPQGTTWCAPEFFREISQDPNGSYVCRFASRSAWRFHPFDASPQEGKLVAIEDTNGNAMSFTYDGAGRLTTITDTLNRNITVGYNVSGQIATVTDFAGRQVQYDYYGPGDPDGSLGDLKSVTSPAVTGTPNGNDFPSGKTTTYTYSTGFANNALNHNLLSVTDPKGQTFRTCVYASTLDPNDPDFDRVVRMTLGEPNDIIDYVYEAQVPDASNGYAVRMTLVNDRNGHVEEYLYDKDNRCVVFRELTGQAVADMPTSSSTNRPTGQVRQSDPPLYEANFRYNENALYTLVIDPEQSVTECVYEGDVNPFSPPRSSGNLLSCVVDPGPRAGDQPQIVVSYEYDSIQNFDTNQITTETDARGHDTTHAYDAAGNRLQTTHRIASIVEDYEYNTFGQRTAHVLPDNGSGSRRRDEMTYYVQGPQTGYLESEIVDASGFALTTTYEYDAVGNVVRTIDPRGNDTLRIVNQLDQVVRLLSRPADPNNPVRYETDTYYDENDNIVQVDVQNRDETGALQANQEFTTLHEYDILDRCVRTTREVAPGQNIVTEFEYDSNSNQVLVRSGEAVANREPTNTVSMLYDERDLLYQEVRAAGDPLQSTTQFDYDGNGNVVQQSDGLENSPRVTTMTYDGYDRLTSTTNPGGNVSSNEYDENSNVVGSQVDGELLDAPGGAANVRLFETTHVYDDMDRLVQTDAEHFDATQSPIGDGVSSTTHVYSDNSQIVSTTDDNGNTTSTVYDTANRKSATTDAKSNSTAWTYDGNSNVVRVTQTEKSDLGQQDEIFQTDNVYDGLDRIVSETDSSGNTRTCGYDSRDNAVVTVDALSNEVRCVYDGLNRATTQTIDMDGDGADGDGTDIVLTTAWDDNSRVFLEVDDNGNATFTGYDPLNRPMFVNRADNTTESYTYDVHNNRLTCVDANGTTTTSTYDAVNRLTGNSMAVGAGVSNATTFEFFEYDGLNRMVAASDNDSVVQREYDSLSNMVEETLQGDVTAMTYDGLGNPLTCVYPSGRTLTYTYDSLNRVSTISEGPTTIASYLYVGTDRVTFQLYGNGTRATYAYDGAVGVPNPAGDSGVKRVVSITHTSGPTTVDARTFTWDAMYNKTERRDARIGGPSLRHAYGYDDAYRLTSGLQEDRLGVGLRLLNYNLDGVGNRNSIGGFGGVTGAYTLDPLDPPADLQVNQYTSTPSDDRLYDDNGNLATVVRSPQQQIVYEYDCYNRLVQMTDPLTGDTGAYAYDALGRRIQRAAAHWGETLDCRYRYAGSSVIEELDPNDVTVSSYVHGVRASEIVCVESGGQVYYQHADDVGNVVALTDPNGAVIERYEYGDFGQLSITDAVGAPLAMSSVGNPYYFQGERLDLETGWYLHGDRYYDPENGRYITRDPAAWSDASSLGNGYNAGKCNPWSDDGHVTVLKGREKGSGMATGHRGPRHRAASGPPHCPGCGAMLCRCTNASRTDGHVTVLKGVHQPGGHATGATRRRGMADTGPPHCPGCGAMLCRCTTASRGDGDKKRKHSGHVTVLKIAGPGGPPHCPGCGALLCRCTGATRAEDDKKHKHKGHVTILKMAGTGGPPHCPGCGAMLCRCKDIAAAQGGIRCESCNMPPGHHKCILKVHQPGGGMTGATRRTAASNGDIHSGRSTGVRQHGRFTGPPHCPGCGALLCRCTNTSASAAAAHIAGGGGGSRAHEKCPRCYNCPHGVSYHKCKEVHTHILPAANNISSR